VFLVGAGLSASTLEALLAIKLDDTSLTDVFQQLASPGSLTAKPTRPTVERPPPSRRTHCRTCAHMRVKHARRELDARSRA
jgi:hypothetical protein